MGQINDNCSRSASTQEQDEHLAVAELAEQLRPLDARSLLFFCSSRYDLPRLATAINQRFSGDTLGCTSSGLLGLRGFQRGGISAVSLSAAAFQIESFLVKPLSDCDRQVEAIAETLKRRDAQPTARHRAFALLLVDGLSTKEEALVSALDRNLRGIPIVGGSAGDDLRLRETHVWFGGAFHTDAAVLAVVTTELPFQTLQVHHFVPSGRRLEITAASPLNRTILKINGEAAALAYADLVEVSMSDLNPNVFSRHPLLLERDGNYFVHSIQRVNGDGSLMMYSAVESGDQPSLGQPRDPLTALENAFGGLPQSVREPSLVIGFDCVLRRLEFEQRRLDATVGRFMADHNVIGFCTYGEQFNALHVNQTFTCVAIKG